MGKNVFLKVKNRGKIPLQKCFTLIDTLVSVAILSFLVMSVVSVLNVGDKMWRTEMMLLDLQQDVRFAMDGMIRELRRSRASDITEGDSQIDFTLDGISNAINYHIDYATGQIIREHPAGTQKILAQNVTNLTFSLSGETVEITIEASKVDRGRTYTYSLTEKVRLRNG